MVDRAVVSLPGEISAAAKPAAKCRKTGQMYDVVTIFFIYELLIRFGSSVRRGQNLRPGI